MPATTVTRPRIRNNHQFLAAFATGSTVMGRRVTRERVTEHHPDGVNHPAWVMTGPPPPEDDAAPRVTEHLRDPHQGPREPRAPRQLRGDGERPRARRDRAPRPGTRPGRAPRRDRSHPGAR